jgi:peptidylprolyl isomerase
MMIRTAFALDLKNTVYLDLQYGRVLIEVLPQISPRHVSQFKQLIRKGFYNGQIFHRVIDGFIAQSGDPTGTGSGRSSLPNLKAEFNDSQSFRRGAVGMARSKDQDSANSQFFICLGDSVFLDGKYTLFGYVATGMDLIDLIAKGEPPKNPDKIIQMQVAADVDQKH